MMETNAWQMADDEEDYEKAAALAVFDFHESRAGVRGLVESGVTTVPPIFLKPTASASSAATAAFAVPSVDISLPRSSTVALVGAAARSCGIFHVTNHGVPAGTVDSALAAVRAFNEQPRAARAAFYSFPPTGDVNYATVPIPQPPRAAGEPATAPLLPWRDSLVARLGTYAAEPQPCPLPAACRGALREYCRSMRALGKEIAGLLSEALGVGAERLEREMRVEGFLLQCHYSPPCPEPSRVVGSRDHTDASLFTVLAQDGVGGLQVNLAGGGGGGDEEWFDVAPVAGALTINIGDVLQVVSNDEYKSVEHRVVIKSAQDARVSIALFFNPEKHDEPDFFGPLPELVTPERPARYRRLTFPELITNRRELGHAKPSSIDEFKCADQGEGTGGKGQRWRDYLSPTKGHARIRTPKVDFA